MAHCVLAPARRGGGSSPKTRLESDGAWRREAFGLERQADCRVVAGSVLCGLLARGGVPEDGAGWGGRADSLIRGAQAVFGAMQMMSALVRERRAAAVMGMPRRSVWGV